MDTYPDQVEIKTEQSSGNEEEEYELQEEDLDKDDKENSLLLKCFDNNGLGLRSHLDYQEDYWIGDSGA